MPVAENDIVGAVRRQIAEDSPRNMQIYLRCATALSDATRIVDEQAEDDGLWFRAETITEAYLQRALRRLHAAIEGDSKALNAIEGK